MCELAVLNWFCTLKYSSFTYTSRSTPLAGRSRPDVRGGLRVHNISQSSKMQPNYAGGPPPPQQQQPYPPPPPPGVGMAFPVPPRGPPVMLAPGQLPPYGGAPMPLPWQQLPPRPMVHIALLSCRCNFFLTHPFHNNSVQQAPPGGYAPIVTAPPRPLMAPMTAVATAVVARPPVFVEKKVDFRNSKQPWGVAVFVGDIPPHVPDDILGRCLECFGRTQVPVAHRCRCCFFVF